MRFICYSAYAEKDIGSNLGVPEYSYYFVLQKFLPLLKQMGEVILVDKPLQQVDEIYLQARQQDIPCVFLSFTAPQNTVMGLQCPTICVFAWEFDSIPTEVFESDCRSNWLTVFNNIAGIITHSSFTTAVLQQSLEENYPMLSLPAPVWDSHNVLAADSFSPATQQEVTLQLDCAIIDTAAVDLQLVEDTLYPEVKLPYPPIDNEQNQSTFIGALRRLGRGIYRDCLSGLGNDYLKAFNSNPAAPATDLLYSEAVSTNISSRNPKVDPLAPVLEHYTDSSASELHLKGVVYTSVLNPNDGRKNWHDLVCGFCIAFKDEPNATLVIKLVQRDAANMLLDLIHRLYQLTPMQCRVVIIDGFLNNTAYSQLIKATHYVLNTAHGEGQCLPLMEFMSAGKPAIAPDHSALGDYIDDKVAFVIESHKEAALFPHDPRATYRTHRFRINWQSLRKALENSFATITQQSERYEQMAISAQERLRNHCSLAVSQEKLQTFLESASISSAINQPAPDSLAESINRHAELRSWLHRCEELADKDGWLDAQSVFQNFPIDSGDIVADLGCSIPEASEYCANLGVHTLLFGQDREHLTRLVNSLHEKQAPRFRAYLSEADNKLPQRSSTIDKVLILNLLQQKSDPLEFLKEATRIGKPGCRYLITVPYLEESTSSELAHRIYPTTENQHKFSAADFQHLVSVAGLEIQHQASIGLYWLLRAMLYKDHNNHSRNASFETISRLLQDKGIDLKQESLDSLESQAAHLIIARKALS